MLFATSNFLIPNGTFIVDVVIFLVVLGVVAKWILPPLLEVTEHRRTGIRTAADAAERARAARRDVLAERERLLAGARAEARSIVDAGNQSAEAALQAGRARGQEEFGQLMTAARADISAERDRVRAELTDRLDTVVVAAAERVVGTSIDASRHSEVIAAAVAAASAAGAESVAGEPGGRS